MSAQIRPFRAADYPRLLDLYNRIEPEYPETEDEWRFQEATRDPKVRWGRLVAELEGRLVGWGDYGQSAENYHPRKFHLGVSVDPDHRRRGIGSALFEGVIATLNQFRPVQLMTESREDRPDSRRFIERRGFRESMREWESRLDPLAADTRELPALRERLAREGIEILSLARLKERDPDWARKLHSLKTALDRDIPSVVPATEVSFEHWYAKQLNHPNQIPEARFFAVHEGRLVGESSLFRPMAGDYLDTGVTGVRREFRRRGIALALKLCAIEYARNAGVREIRTWNATTNEAMLSINLRLGFQRQPAWIFYTREEQEEPPDTA